MDQPVLQLGVEVPPGVGPGGGLQPGAARRHHGGVAAGGGGGLVELDPVEALHPRVGEGEEALAVVGVPPGPVRQRQRRVGERARAAYGLERPPERRCARVGVRDMDVQRPCPARAPLPPCRHMLPARQQGLYGRPHAVVLCDLGRGIAPVAVGERLEGRPGADRVRRVEHPPEVALTRARGDLDGQDRAVVVHQGPQGERALVRAERPGQLGVAQAEPPVQAGDRAHRLQREVADREAGQPEQRAELGAVVLHLGVLDVEAHGAGPAVRPGARLGVDAGTEEAVAEEGALVPGRRHPLPDEVGVFEDGAPGVGGGRTVGCARLCGQAACEEGPAEGGSGGEHGTSGRAGHDASLCTAIHRSSNSSELSRDAT